MDNELTEEQLKDLIRRFMDTKFTRSTELDLKKMDSWRELMRQTELKSDPKNMKIWLELLKLARKSLEEQDRELWKSTDYFDDFSDRLLRFVPPKHLERAYEPSKYDAEAKRLERLEKDGNEVSANREYRHEMRKLVLSTLLTLPRFFIGEILGQVRRMIAR